MNTKKNLNIIRKLHINIEQKLQQLNIEAAGSYCCSCDSVCCREEICRETIDSSFLRFIIGPLIKNYDKINGWHDGKLGCKLKFGRPLICYSFFCSKIPDNEIQKVSDIIHEFSKAYTKIYRGKHILLVDNLSEIKIEKLEKVQKKLEEVLLLATQIKFSNDNQ